MKSKNSGKLKIGNNWNAITIIALSQSNPLKAIAEFVENSIDAKAKNITIIRGKKKGEAYLKVVDDGEGIDDFNYVATHIGDSIKRKLKKHGAKEIQGEFGIGLLSFWTVGNELTITSAGQSKKPMRIKMIKNNPGYNVSEVRTLFLNTGTEILIKPILPGIKQLSGEKIQNYLASELRDRISKTGVKIKILDKTSRKELLVEPRKFKGRLLHDLPRIKSPLGEIYYELYLSEPSADNRIGLYKLGTRVIPSVTSIEALNCFPWNSPYIEGIIDASFLQLTPGTRGGFVYDEAFDNFLFTLKPLADKLAKVIEEQKRAEEEKASRKMLYKITKALQEAYNHLPQDEYSWLAVKKAKKIEIVKEESTVSAESAGSGDSDPVYISKEVSAVEKGGQQDFFDYPGPLYSAVIKPASVVMRVGETKKLRIAARDRKKHEIEADYQVIWFIEDGEGEIDNPDSKFITFTAPKEPGIIVLKAIVKQKEIECSAECVITVTEELLKQKTADEDSEDGKHKGLPGYTFQKAPGELWRSRYDAVKSIIVVNNGHADFIFASKNRKRQLKYITKLFTKELVLNNFPEVSKEELLERIIELQMYTEENLK